MSGSPWDPSPQDGAPIDMSMVRATLLDRIRRTLHSGLPAVWGFAVSGEIRTFGARETGWLVIVTPTDSLPLTGAMVEATQGRAMFLLGCARVSLGVPAVCDRRWYHAHEPIPGVEIRADIRCTWPRVGGGRIEATVEYWQAANSPLVILTDEPIPGWPI
jgi:hypothetical protein